MKQTKWDYSTLNLIAATEEEMLLTCKIAWCRINVTSFLEIGIYLRFVSRQSIVHTGYKESIGGMFAF